MKIAIIGTGYVGLPTGVGLVEQGHHVTCIDKKKSTINSLNAGKLTLFENGLSELFEKNRKTGRLHFTTSIKEGIKDAEIIIIAVNTPIHAITKEVDMDNVYAVACELAQYIEKYTVIAMKSTVPIGTGDKIEALMKEKNSNIDIDAVSLPEFLREGHAIHDFFNPDRIIVGLNSTRARKVIENFYKPFKGKVPILFVSRRSGEIIKYASNAFLAMKIHFINEMSDFCEKSGANVYEVAEGVGLDTRIGSRFLNPGPGYGGSCLPKDTNAIAHMGRKIDTPMSLIEAAIQGNEWRKKQIAWRILDSVKDLVNPKICILGLAFKADTDDCRESPALTVIEYLLERKMNLVVFDPQAMKNAKNLLEDKVTYAKDEYAAAKDADTMVILTEWGCFRNLDLKKIGKTMRTKKIMDFRNLINQEHAKNAGFEYCRIGVS